MDVQKEFRQDLSDDKVKHSPLVQQVEPNSDSDNRKFVEDEVIYEAVTAHFRQDLSLFWTRANFYLIVQVGLISVVATILTSNLSSMDKIVTSGLCLVGLILAIFWFIVMRGSIFWICRWREQIIKIDKVVSRFQSYATIENRLQGSPILSPSIVTQYLPVLFVVAWITIGVVVLLVL